MTSVRSVCGGYRVGGLPLLLTTALHFAVPEMTSEGQSLGQKIRARIAVPLYPSLPSSSPRAWQHGEVSSATLPKKQSFSPGQHTRPQVSDSRPVESVSKAESRIEDVPF